MNISVQASLQDPALNFFGHIRRSGIVVSRGNSIYGSWLQQSLLWCLLDGHFLIPSLRTTFLDWNSTVRKTCHFLSICLFIQLFCLYQYELMDIYSVSYNALFSLFCWSNCSMFGCWELLQVPFHVPSFFEHFLVSWHHKMFQVHVVFSLL